MAGKKSRRELGRGMTLSGAIVKAQRRFTADELVASAEELLREHATSPLHDALAPSLLVFYAERRLVDPPSRDAAGALCFGSSVHASVGGDFYERRHLLQLMAVQVLRGLDLTLEEIGELVRGLDDNHLRLLIDDPEEAEKKANVMRNWLGMIAKGRYKPKSGQSALVDSGAYLTPELEPPPISRPGVTQPPSPERVPPPVPSGLVSKRTVMGHHNKAKSGDIMPDDLPTASVPVLSATRRSRPSAGRPALPPRRSTLPAGTKLENGASRTSRESAERISNGFIVGDRYVRHVLADGIELHVSARAAASRVESDALNIMIGRLRALLER